VAEGKVFWQRSRELVFVFCVPLHLIELDSLKINLAPLIFIASDVRKFKNQGEMKHHFSPDKSTSCWGARSGH